MPPVINDYGTKTKKTLKLGASLAWTAFKVLGGALLHVVEGFGAGVEAAWIGFHTNTWAPARAEISAAWAAFKAAA